MNTPHQNLTRDQAMQDAMVEMSAITKKAKLTRQDHVRFNFLQTRVSALKAGFDPTVVATHELNTIEDRDGLPLTQVRQILTREQREEAAMWREFVHTGKVEYRDQVTGHPLASSLNGNLGAFVPMDFFYSYLPKALRQYDPLFDEEAVTYLATEHARPLQVPNVSAIDTVASIVSESNSINEVDTDSAGQTIVGGYAYKTPLWRVSLEAWQDLEASYGIVEMFKAFTAQRVALGAGADLLTGSGVGKPTGLITSLVANSPLAVGRVAQGSSANDGSSNTGANSIGWSDLRALFYSVNAAYRSSPKCAWLMNDSTAQFITSLVDKSGRPLDVLNLEERHLFGKPVLISPSMDSIGASKNPVLFGDMSYWLTRVAKGTGYIKAYTEAPGLIEKGEIGLRAFVRVDGTLMFNDPNQAPPIRILQNHS